MGNFQVIMLSFFAYYCINSNKWKNRVWGLLVMLIQIPLFLNMISNELSTAQYSFFWENNYYFEDILEDTNLLLNNQ